jgi:hypothetical protein
MTMLDRLMSHVQPEPNSGCWLWDGGQNQHGYGRFNVDGKNDKAHRASWRLHKGQIPAGLFVLHRCDIPCCVNPDHLFLGTHLDNTLDRMAKGRRCAPSSERSSNAKFTPDLVRHIRASKIPNVQLAEMLSVDRGTILRIRNLRSWREVV